MSVGEPERNKDDYAAVSPKLKTYPTARAYLHSAEKAAVRCNPAIRALYRRLRARGKRDISSQRSTVTAAIDSVESDGPAVNSTNPKRPFVDFADIRTQVSMRQIVEHLDVLQSLRPSGGELRGPCLLHASSQSNRARHFAVNLDKNVFRCFSCQAQRNQLDFRAAVHHMSSCDAALDLVKTFHPNSTG